MVFYANCIAHSQPLGRAHLGCLWLKANRILRVVGIRASFYGLEVKTTRLLNRVVFR